MHTVACRSNGVPHRRQTLVRARGNPSTQHHHHSAAVATDVAAASEAHGEAPVLPYRVGHGFDLHRLEPGFPLIIGGVNIPHERGCDAHSDGAKV